MFRHTVRATPASTSSPPDIGLDWEPVKRLPGAAAAFSGRRMSLIDHMKFSGRWNSAPVPRHQSVWTSRPSGSCSRLNSIKRRLQTKRRPPTVISVAVRPIGRGRPRPDRWTKCCGFVRPKSFLTLPRPAGPGAPRLDRTAALGPNRLRDNRRHRTGAGHAEYHSHRRSASLPRVRRICSGVRGCQTAASWPSPTNPRLTPTSNIRPIPH